MHVPKPTEADERYFRSIVPADPRIEVKPMFGNLGALVNGNMFMGLFGSQVGLKLTPSEIAALMSIDGAGPFGPSERPMAGYVSLPPAWRGDPQAAQWSRALSMSSPPCRRRSPREAEPRDRTLDAYWPAIVAGRCPDRQLPDQRDSTTRDGSCRRDPPAPWAETSCPTPGRESRSSPAAAQVTLARPVGVN